jgi:hypothetical protein
MRTSIAARGIVWVALTAHVGLVSPASAQTPSSSAPAPKPLAATLTGEAKTNYDIAVTLYRDKDFANAHERFAKAYELSNDPRLLYNMASCQKTLRHYAEAKRLLEKYVRDGTAQGLVTDADKRDAETLLGVFQTLVGPLKLDVNESGATVLVDGAPAGTTPLAGPVTVDLGTRHVRVLKEGFKDFDADVKVDIGKEASLKVVLTAPTREGRVSVRSTEPSSSIYLDGKRVGTGAEWFGSVAAGSHLLRVTAPDFAPYQADFTLTEGAVRTFEVTLKAEKKPVPVWIWIGGGVLLAGGLATAGYFLFRPRDKSECEETPGAPSCVRSPVSDWTITLPE